MRYINKINKVAFHRNGIAGEGFYVVSFKVDNINLIGIVFDGKGQVAVLEQEPLGKGVIGGASEIASNNNAWRGDTFEKELREAVEKYSSKPHTIYEKLVEANPPGRF